MPIKLTMCRQCARGHPELLQAIARLLAAHPDRLAVEELECIAACNDAPAVMVEGDYHPRVRPCDLTRIVQLRLSQRR